jgi:ABC-type metal ion transport system substrate-binding protein
VLNQVDLALINANTRWKPSSIRRRTACSPRPPRRTPTCWWRPDNKDSAAVKLAAALNSPEAKRFIESKYQGRGGTGVLSRAGWPDPVAPRFAGATIPLSHADRARQ